MNAQSQHTPQEVIHLGRNLYDSQIRSQLETPENEGKLISIEVFTGDFEVGENHLGTTMLLRSRHPAR